MLDDEADYDALGEREQAIVRGVWTERIGLAAANVDLTDAFKAQRRKTASVADIDGNLVVVELDGDGKPVKAKGKPKKRAPR